MYVGVVVFFPSTMSAVGIQFGNETLSLAVAERGGAARVVCSEMPAIFNIYSDVKSERSDDDSKSIRFAASTSKNIVSQVKRLLGKTVSEVKPDLVSLPFVLFNEEESNAIPEIFLQYKLLQVKLTPARVLTRMFSKLKSIVEEELKEKATDIDYCIGIPVYFTDLQRKAVEEAAEQAKLNRPRVFYETTAVALAYGYKTACDDARNVAFVDVGHSSLQVCIAAFKKGGLKMLAYSFDMSLGGREIDEALFKHFVDKIRSKHLITVKNDRSACLELRATCQILKELLTKDTKASKHILIGNKSVKCSITRDKLVKISTQILQRVKQPLQEALTESRLSIDDLHSVEVVGSGSRVPAVLDKLKDFFGKMPSRTMEASVVSEGCLRSILSPEFEVHEHEKAEEDRKLQDVLEKNKGEAQVKQVAGKKKVAEEKEEVQAKPE